MLVEIGFMAGILADSPPLGNGAAAAKVKGRCFVPSMRFLSQKCSYFGERTSFVVFSHVQRTMDMTTGDSNVRMAS